MDFNVVIEQGEDGFLISDVIEIPGCHTQAKTMPELIERTKEVIALCLEEGVNDNKTKFIGVKRVVV